MKKIVLIVLFVVGILNAQNEFTLKHVGADSSDNYTAVITNNNREYPAAIRIPVSLEGADSMYFKVGTHPDSLFVLQKLADEDSSIYVIQPRVNAWVTLPPDLFYTYKYWQVWFDATFTADKVFAILNRRY